METNIRELVLFGTWSRKKVDDMLKAARQVHGLQARMEFISRQFLGLSYRESTLMGSVCEPETLVINFEAMDCFTFIDCVEAMRHSLSFEEFKQQLMRVRYKSGQVNFTERNHFFSDWLTSGTVRDVTGEIGHGKTVTVSKMLNKRADGSVFVVGIEPVERQITYIPAANIDAAVFRGLETGDYAGIYAEAEGLDVSHVGVLVRIEQRLLFRHASAVVRTVVDQDLEQYLSGRPGILTWRPTP